MDKTKQPRKDEGFTLLELLVVLGIIALLAALVAPAVVRYLGAARGDAGGAQLKNIESALELYYLDTGAYPPNDVGLAALVEAPANVKNWRGPYLKKKEGLVDPWGKSYQYALPGKHGVYDIFSYGRDGKEGGQGEDRDLVSW